MKTNRKRVAGIRKRLEDARRQFADAVDGIGQLIQHIDQVMEHIDELGDDAVIDEIDDMARKLQSRLAKLGVLHKVEIGKWFLE